MASYFVNGLRLRPVSLVSGDRLSVGATGDLQSGDTAVSATGNAISMRISGRVTANHGDAIWCGGEELSVTIVAGGSVTTLGNAPPGTLVISGLHGLIMQGDEARLANAGLIEGQQGLAFRSDGGQAGNAGTIRANGDADGVGVGLIFEGEQALFRNTGTITSASLAVQMGGTATSGEYLYNGGTITGALGVLIEASALPGTTIFANAGRVQGSAGIAVQIAANGGALQNQGDVRGNVIGADGRQEVLNYGTILGDVLLRADADDYHAYGGGDVSGVVAGGSGHDSLTGAAQIDLLRGDAGDDTLSGGGSGDGLFGGTGADVLWGGAEGDTLNGGGGNDRLAGGPGWDDLTGGDGRDVFLFGATPGTDRITDFSPGQDRIDLSFYAGLNFDALTAAGAFSADWGGTLIDLRSFGGDRIALTGLLPDVLTANDFIF